MGLTRAIGNSRTQERRVLDRLRSKAVAPEQSAHARRAEKALLLLEEFEKSGKGWFWETDADGALTYASEALGKTMGGDAPVGRRLTDLLADEGQSGQRSLAFHLAHGLSFTDVTVKPCSDHDVWWSLSGRPIHDERGRFAGFRGFGTDLTEMRRSEAEIARLAHYDCLTGLPNRTTMRSILQRTMGESGPRFGGVSVILIDLDRFKQINDTLGHLVGDELLCDVSARLEAVVGDAGEVGRLGGDEFEAVLPGLVDTDELGSLAAKIIDHVTRPYVIRGHKVSVGASLGIATAVDRLASIDELIRDADLALYAAKNSSLDSYRFYSAEMHAEAQERQQLETELRSAMTDHGLALMYQPVVNAATEEIVGFEALLRWLHPTHGQVSPAKFVQLAEETGLILRMGEWVLRTACAEAARWSRKIRLAVNLSPIQFSDPALPSLIMNALASADLAPDRLELEITESVFLNDGAATEAMFARLRAIGTRFALDDFGTGYSSLGYLRNAPFSKIKIDQSFVRGAADRSNRNSAIIKAIVSLAESLDMETTAEGVETHDELAHIRALGCSQVQGYLFGRPMTAEEARALVGKDGTIKPRGFRARRPPRHAVFKSARLFLKDMEIPVRVRNVSSGGALVEAAVALPSDSEIRLELDGIGILPGFVCWSSESKAGLRFASDVDPQVLVQRKPVEVRRRKAA